MEYDFKNCIYPLGALWITYDNYTQKVELKRCLWHRPFITMSIDEYNKIDDIIDYSLKFDYPEMEAFYLEKDKCGKICQLPPVIKNVSVSISHACNLNCLHCYFENAHSDTKDQQDAYFSTLEKIKGHYLDKILLTDNGEPFFYYQKIIDYLKSLTTADTQLVEITTNLTLLNEERVKELYDTMTSTGLKYNFIISIDGISKETFEATRIGANWEKAMKNAELLVKYFGTNNVVISYVIRRPAMNDAQFAKSFFMKKLGIRTDIYYDFYDEECKKLFYDLKHLEYLN